MCQHKQDDSQAWFSSCVEYSGQGKAYFENPKGYIEGYVRVSVDESCQEFIEMIVENIESEEQITFGLLEFLSNERPVENSGQLTHCGRPGTNPCVRLEISCSDGIFNTFGKIFYNPIISFTEGGRVQFFMPSSEFLLSSNQPPKFWVIPLVNYIGDFQEINHSLIDHPLRLRKTPYPLVTFAFHDKQGYVESLLDIQERRQKLVRGERQRLITAIMVGEIWDVDIDINNLEEKLPFALMALLSLATESEVSAAWVELRDADGKLIKRLHSRRFSRPYFSKGHQVIPTVDNSDARETLKHLLAQAQTSTYFGKAPLGPVISDLVDSGLETLTIEDRLNRICRGFDHLCKCFDLDQQNLANELDSSSRDSVMSQLKDSARAVRNLVSSNADSSQTTILNKIANRIVNSANVDRDFGLSVTALLDQFGLPDAQIINSYYASNARPDERTSWSSVISCYRGIAVHVGYFELGSNADQYDVDDLVRVTFHLQDILTRIVLKMLNYDYIYYPSVLQQHRTKMSVDWVQVSTPASQLGY